jgi:hypothetical protein
MLKLTMLLSWSLPPRTPSRPRETFTTRAVTLRALPARMAMPRLSPTSTVALSAALSTVATAWRCTTGMATSPAVWCDNRRSGSLPRRGRAGLGLWPACRYITSMAVSRLSG